MIIFHLGGSNLEEFMTDLIDHVFVLPLGHLSQNSRKVSSVDFRGLKVWAGAQKLLDLSHCSMLLL